MSDAPNINLACSELLLAEFARCGGTHVFATPGSRSAPLVIAASRCERLTLVMCIDERSASYGALGLARVSGVPAIALTTSGTAAANLLPAVVEANQAGVPLLLLTADRPPEMLDCGANQAIRQEAIFGAQVRWATTLPVPHTGADPRVWLSTMDQAFALAKGLRPGPVHVNCPFTEPLAPTPQPWAFARGADIARWREGHAPWRRLHATHVGLRDPSLIEQLMRESRGAVIVAGAIEDPEEAYHARALVQRAPWPVIADITSGLRTPGTASRTLRHGTLLLRAAADPAAGRLPKADLVIRIGGACAWRHVDEWCSRAGRLVVVGAGTRFDPHHAAAEHAPATIAELAALDAWKDCDAGATLAAWQRADQAADVLLREAPASSEPAIAAAVAAAIPEGAALFAGSSMPIRDLDAFAGSRETACRVAGNRGASGIDGSFATMAGLAHGGVPCVIGLIGDMAAFHDLSSLELLARSPVPAVAVVVNNDGGGIFESLPIAQHADVLERLFVMPHGRDLAQAARGFGIGYQRADDAAGAAEALRKALRRQGASIVEVRVARAASVAARRALIEGVARALPRR